MPSSRGIFPTQRSNPGILHFRQILYHLSHQGSPTSVKKLFHIRSFWGSGVGTSTYILGVHNWTHNTPSIATVLLMCSSTPLPPVCGPFQAASCWDSPEGATGLPSADTSLMWCRHTVLQQLVTTGTCTVTTAHTWLLIHCELPKGRGHIIFDSEEWEIPEYLVLSAALNGAFNRKKVKEES